MDWINYTLFTIGGDNPVILIDLLTSLAGLTCVILAGRNSKYNFWVGYLYSFLLLLMFYNKNLYANLLLQPISLGINILGHYRWTHPKAGEESSDDGKSLKVSMLTWPQRIAILVADKLGRECCVPGQIYVGSDSLSGCVHDNPDTGCPDFVIVEEMGLLDCMAVGECCSTCNAHLCRSRVYADCLCAVPRKRTLVHRHVVAALQERRLALRSERLSLLY